jgi:hypothetical protein
LDDKSKKVWWGDLRPVHAALYYIFSYLAIVEVSPQAFAPLLFDAGVAIGAFAMKNKKM